MGLLTGTQRRPSQSHPQSEISVDEPVHLASEHQFCIEEFCIEEFCIEDFRLEEFRLEDPARSLSKTLPTEP